MGIRRSQYRHRLEERQRVAEAAAPATGSQRHILVAADSVHLIQDTIMPAAHSAVYSPSCELWVTLLGGAAALQFCNTEHGVQGLAPLSGQNVPPGRPFRIVAGSSGAIVLLLGTADFHSEINAGDAGAQTSGGGQPTAAGPGDAGSAAVLRRDPEALESDAPAPQTTSTTPQIIVVQPHGAVAPAPSPIVPGVAATRRRRDRPRVHTAVPGVTSGTNDDLMQMKAEAAAKILARPMVEGYRRVMPDPISFEEGDRLVAAAGPTAPLVVPHFRQPGA